MPRFSPAAGIHLRLRKIGLHDEQLRRQVACCLCGHPGTVESLNDLPAWRAMYLRDLMSGWNDRELYRQVNDALNDLERAATIEYHYKPKPAGRCVY